MTQLQSTAAAAAKPTGSHPAGRKMRISDVRVAIDGKPDDQPVSGIRQIRSFVDKQGCGHCHITTLDIDTAKALPVNAHVTVYGRFHDVFSNDPDPEPTCLGRFRVEHPPLFSGGMETFGEAIIRLADI